MKYSKQTAEHLLHTATIATQELIEKKVLEQHIASSPNLDNLKRVYLHRQAIFKVANDLEIDASQFRMHDADKYYMYLWMHDKDANECHELINNHHNYLDAAFLSETDLTEMMLDWESARFTKPEIKSNAYDIMLSRMPDEVFRPIIPLMQKYEIYEGTFDKGINKKQYTAMAEKITPSILAEEIQNLFSTNPQ